MELKRFDRSHILDDRGGRTPTDEDFANPLIWKRSGLSHDNIPRYYFG